MTFLFTDVEGSTRLWDEYPVDARQALTRHDALIDALVAEHEGWSCVHEVRATAGSPYSVEPQTR